MSKNAGRKKAARSVMYDKLPIFRERFKDLCDRPEFKRNGKFNYSAIANFVGEDTPPNTIKNYLEGDRVAQSDMAIKISKAFNVSIDYLFGISDISSINADLKAACKYTGLSEKAITNIRDMLISPTCYYLDNASDLLEHPQLRGIIYKANDLKSQAEAASWMMNYYGDYHDKDIKILKSTSDIVNNLRLAFFETCEEFNSYIRKLYDIENIIKKYQIFEREYTLKIDEFLREESSKSSAEKPQR